MILPAGLNLTKTVYLNLFQHAPCLFTLNIDFATITFVLVLILHKMVIMITMSGFKIDINSSRNSRNSNIIPNVNWNGQENISYSTTATLIRAGRFYSIYGTPDNFIMEDKTKSGLEVKERYFDSKYETDCDSGICSSKFWPIVSSRICSLLFLSSGPNGILVKVAQCVFHISSLASYSLHVHFILKCNLSVKTRAPTFLLKRVWDMK
jgi:hypothetical protein